MGLGSSCRGRTYCPIYYQALGSYFYVCLYCYAMLVDVVWVSESMTDVRLLINGLLKVATLIQVWMDCLWAPGESSVVLGYLGVPM